MKFFLVQFLKISVNKKPKDFCYSLEHSYHWDWKFTILCQSYWYFQLLFILYLVLYFPKNKYEIFCKSIFMCSQFFFLMYRKFYNLWNIHDLYWNFGKEKLLFSKGLKKTCFLSLDIIILQSMRVFSPNFWEYIFEIY